MLLIVHGRGNQQDLFVTSKFVKFIIRKSIIIIFSTMAGHNVNVCDIGEDVKEKLKKFRFQKHTSNSALILKVNREKQALEVDEELDNIELEELQDILPSHQPRFIVYSYKLEHTDGRISFPMCFIFYTPRDAHMELQVMYAGTQRALAAAVGAPRLLEVREIDELTNDWLNDKLKKAFGLLTRAIRDTLLFIKRRVKLQAAAGKS